MKKHLLLQCIALAIYSIAYTQDSSPSSAASWTGLIETGTECEVYYSYVNCNAKPKILLKFYNEVPFNQNIKIKVTAKYLGYVFTEEKVIILTPNQTITGECNSTDKNLYIDLTPLWDFTQSTIEAQVIDAKTN